jgi:fructokinase
VRFRNRKFPGGAPANVACGLAKLGVRSMFAGAIGNDDDGKELSKLFGDLKVETLCRYKN